MGKRENLKKDRGWRCDRSVMISGYKENYFICLKIS